ncbi:MAG: diacylglycerol kinase family protein [Jatrophihabitantaceae bacterium]
MSRVRKPAVVCNPAAVEDIEQLAKEILARCSALGAADPLWFETTPEDPGGGQARQALAAGADLVLVCGGDGTVAAGAGVLAGTDVAMALVPVGTGNLLARNVGVPLDLGPALDVAFGADRRCLDVLESDDHRFLVMAGLGFDAALIRDTDDKAKARLGWVAYLGGAARAVRRTPAASYTITVDDGVALHRRGVGVLIGNVGRLQAGLRALPDAKPDDGVLDVGVLEPRTWHDWPMLVLRLLAGRPDSGPQAEIFRGRRVEISCDQQVPLEYDGDYVGETAALNVHVLAGALTLCAPPP